MFRKFKALSRIKKFGLGTAVIFVLALAGGTSQPKANLNVQNTSGTTSVLGAHTSNASPKQKTPVVTTETTTETQPVPFTNTTVSSSSLAAGTNKITTPGVNGISTLTYKITLTDGVQTKKELLTQIITTPPVNQVTTVGTYVAPAQPSCPNGTYVNTYGSTVCSPYASNSAPAGATAQCVDDTYSFSQSHSGTCSHHGGVSAWL